MRIGYLGAGSWGFALASLLAEKGHKVVLWTICPDTAKVLTETKEHPNLPGYKAVDSLRVTTDLKEALDGAELIVESVSSMGVRPVF